MTDANRKGPPARRPSWVAKVDLVMRVGLLLTAALSLVHWLITGQW